MCQENNKFIFCTCLDKAEHSEHRHFLKDFTWTLTNFLGLKKTLIMGKIILPKQDLGKGVNIEKILNQLNHDIENFDFDYSPKERDCLVIEAQNEDKRRIHFKILYKDGKWIQGSNPPFTTIFKTIATGKILKTSSQQNKKDQ